METNDILDQNYGADIELTNQSIGFLKESARWAKFLSIIGFISLGLMVLGGIAMGAFMGTTPDTAGIFPFPPILISAFYIVFAIVYFFPILYLYRFAGHTNRAIQQQDTAAMTLALQNLKSMFRFTGILMIIVLGLYLLGIVFGGIMGLTAL